MTRLSSARDNHISRWVLPVSARLLIEEASIGVPVKSLGQVAHIEMGQSPPGDSYNVHGEGVPFIGGPADLGLRHPEVHRWTSLPTKYSQSGDILVCVRATIGEPRWADGIYCIGRGVAAIRPLRNDIDSNFLFRIVQAQEDWLRSQGTGTTFITVTKEHVCSMLVPMVSIEEQKQISSFLTWIESHSTFRPDFSSAPGLPKRMNSQKRIVARIEELAAKIEEARGLKGETLDATSALMPSLITRMLADCGRSWKSMALPTLVRKGRHSLKRGPFGSTLRKEFFVKTGYKVYEQKHAIYGNFDSGSYFIDHDRFKRLQAFELKAGDLIISCSGTIGRVAIVPKDAAPGIINQALLKLSLDSDIILPEFFKVVFESEFMKARVANLSPGSAMKNMGSMKLLRELPFPLPAIKEQEDFLRSVGFVQSKVDALKKLQAESSAELNALLPSILDKAFKGEM